jgi:hypothetical protein
VVVPLWGPFSTFDEHLQDYLAGRNFAEYGFFPTALLPDLSSSQDPAGHPLTYNHQPPGPQLLIGAAVRLLGERYDVIRVLFVALFTAGIAAYLRFLHVLDAGSLPGAVAALLLVNPRTLLHAMDHPAYALMPLFAFVPLLAAIRANRGPTLWWRPLAIALVFVGSNYLIYGPLLMIFTFWLLLAFARLLPLTRRDVATFAAVAALALVLHLLQTVVLVGPAAMARETMYVVSNRMTGRPTRQELEAFYASLGLLLYGGHEFSLVRWLGAIGRSLLFAGTPLMASAAVVATMVMLAPAISRSAPAAVRLDAGKVLTVTVAVVIAVVVPCLVFPAFAIDYGLQGTGEFLLAIASASGAVLAWRIIRHLPRHAHRIAAAVVVVGVAIGALVQTLDVARAVRRTMLWAQSPVTEMGLAWVSQNLHRQPVMTNIDPMAIGFLTREVAVGGCHRAALAGTPDPGKCAIRLGNAVALQRAGDARVYVWVGVGNAFCSARTSCVERSDLDRGYATLFANELVAVYDLTRPRVSPSS